MIENAKWMFILSWKSRSYFTIKDLNDIYDYTESMPVLYWYDKNSIKELEHIYKYNRYADFISILLTDDDKLTFQPKYSEMPIIWFLLDNIITDTMDFIFENIQEFKSEWVVSFSEKTEDGNIYYKIEQAIDHNWNLYMSSVADNK